MLKLKQRVWFVLHGWFSLPVWAIFCAVCLTGTLAVFSHELTWLTNPNARASNPQQQASRPVPELITALKQQVPDAEVSSVLVMEPYLVTALLFSTAGQPPGIAYVNPYTAQVQELNYGPTFINFIRSLHGWLLFPWQNGYSVGYYLVCAMALVMLGALITGLVIYKNFWRSFTAPKVRLHQGKKTILADLHRLAGVWSIWFLALMSLTGLWYLTQAILWHNGVDVYKEAPMLSQQQLPAPAAAPPPAYSLDHALNAARQTFPQLQPAYIGLPEHQRDVYKISGSGDSLWFDSYAWSVYVSPWTGQVIDSYSPAQMTPLQTVMHIADPLHYGTIGGLWTKSIWFLFGLLLSGMSITGFMIWAGRTVKASRRQPSSPAATEGLR